MKKYIYFKYPVEGEAIAEISVDWNIVKSDEIDHIIELWAKAEGFKLTKRVNWKDYIVMKPIYTTNEILMVRKRGDKLIISKSVIESELVDENEML